jgi:hypothetical protein
VSFGISVFGRKSGFSPVEMSGSVGTGGHTAAAADAPVVVDNDNSVRIGECGANRTAFNTRRIFALLAGHGEVKMAFMGNLIMVVVEIGMSEVDTSFLFHLQDLDPEDLGVSGLIVLCLAGIDTFSTSNTSGKIEAIAEQGIWDSFFGGNCKCLSVFFGIFGFETLDDLGDLFL